MRKTVMYLRKSRADMAAEARGEFETLKKHETQLLDLAKRNGDTIDEVYRELVSGESISERVEFQRLIEDVRGKNVGKIYVHAVDRLGRGDMMEYGYVLSTLQWTKTLIVTPEKTYYPHEPIDNQQLQFSMLFSNVEYMHIKRRMREGKVNSTMQGQYVCGYAPIGYDRAVIDGKKTLVKNGDAKYVAMMFDIVADGGNTSIAATRMNALGFRTRNGKMWTPRKVNGVIGSETYKGYVTYGKVKNEVDSRDGMSWKRKRSLQDDYVCCKGLHEPIVSEEVWERANAAAFPASPCGGSGKRMVNPLSGLVVCGKCGATMKRQPGGNSVTLIHRQYTDCPGCKGTKMDTVVDMVVDALASLASDYEVYVERGEQRPSMVAEIEQNIARLNAKVGRLVELYTDGEITREMFSGKKAALESELSDAAALLDAERARDEVPAEVVAMQLRDLVMMLKDSSIDAELRNSALKKLVERIEYTREDGDSEPKLDIYLR